MCFAVLLLAALLSYHPRDVSANAVPQSVRAELDWPVRGLAGLLLFPLDGRGGFCPARAAVLRGLGLFLRGLCLPATPLGWVVVLLVCCMGLLDLYRDYFRACSATSTRRRRRSGPQPEPALLPLCFGTAGATIIFLMLYFISLLFLTNFQLGEWIAGSAVARRRPGARRRPRRRRSNAAPANCKTGQKNYRTKSTAPALAPTCNRCPNPPSAISASRRLKPGAAKSRPSPSRSRSPRPADEGEVIPAREVAAATAADVLGKKPEAAGPSRRCNADGRLPRDLRRGQSPDPARARVHVSGLPKIRSRRPGSPSPSPSPPPR